MIDLKKITKGWLQEPAKILAYGFDGVGKTKFCSGAPDPFFIDADVGSRFYNVRRVVPENWAELMEWVLAVETGKVPCGSLVLDSMTTIEAMAHLEFFPGSNVDKWDDGYGRGDTHALIRWRELLGALERVRARGKFVLMTAHTNVKKFDDPQGPSYERFEVSVRPKFAGLLRQWNDYVFFCREDVTSSVVKTDKKKATTTGTRWAYTRRCPAFDAKARGTTLFPEKFLLSWDEFSSAVASEAKRSSEMLASIELMLIEIGDGAYSKTVLDWVKSNPDGIVEAQQRVTVRLEDKRAQSAEQTKVPDAPPPNGGATPA